MTRALKNLKNLHFNGLVLTKVYNVSVKKVERSYVWLHSRLIQSLKKNWLVIPKIGMRNLENFHQSTWKSPNWDLDGILLSKVENLWPSKVHGSYMSWQWRMRQKLKRNSPLSSKLTWGIWRILTRTLENLKHLHFNGLLLTKVHNVWAEKSLEELFDGTDY